MGTPELVSSARVAVPQERVPETKIRPELREEPTRTDRERLQRAQEELEMLQRDAGLPGAGPRRRMAALKRLTGRVVEDAAELDRAYAEEIVRMTARVRALERSPLPAIREELLLEYLSAADQEAFREGRLQSCVDIVERDAAWLREVDVERTYHDDAYYRAMFGTESGFTYRAHTQERHNRKEPIAETKHEFIDRVVREREDRLRETQEAMHVLGMVRGRDGLIRLHTFDRPHDPGVLIDAALAHAFVQEHRRIEEAARMEGAQDTSERIHADRARLRDNVQRLLGRAPELTVTPEVLFEPEVWQDTVALALVPTERDAVPANADAPPERRRDLLRVVPGGSVEESDDFEITEDTEHGLPEAQKEEHVAPVASPAVAERRATPPDVELGLRVFGVLDRAKAEGWSANRAEYAVRVTLQTGTEHVSAARLQELQDIVAEDLAQMRRTETEGGRGTDTTEQLPETALSEKQARALRRSTRLQEARDALRRMKTELDAHQARALQDSAHEDGRERPSLAGGEGAEVDRAPIGPEAVREARIAYATERQRPSKWGWIAERAKGVLTAGFSEFRHFVGYGRAAWRGEREIDTSFRALRAEAGATPEAQSARIGRLVDEAEFHVMQRLTHYRDEFGDGVLTEDRMQKFRERLHRKLHALHDQQEQADRGEFRNLILQSFDPSWWRRGVYGVVEFALAASGIRLLIDHAFTATPILEQVTQSPLPKLPDTPPDLVRTMQGTVWDTMRQMFPGANHTQLTDVVRKVMEHNGIVDPTPGSTGFTHANGTPNQWAGEHVRHLVESGRNWVDATKMPEGFPLRMPKEVLQLVGSL
ncbi:hypothetical protein HYV74_00350 [Candidatus Uhrbacteria bacterium]|nr:hypothetical protein [Candidatus Uhrbacteria bacterium]